MFFPVNLAKFQRTPFYRTPLDDYLLILYAKFREFIFSVLTVVQFTNLQINKILNTDTNRIFSISWKEGYVHIFEI